MNTEVYKTETDKSNKFRKEATHMLPGKFSGCEYVCTDINRHKQVDKFELQ